MTPMEISEAWWHLFILTGSIEAYLLYHDSLQGGGFAPVELVNVNDQPGINDE
ncbi:hypothetical protein SDD30_05330 [Moorella naiadis]|uniref:hypothetical protein n=1 Tax=Moorella naiadis (nom. illeg.) TaxID=3093670 RepID=UPI003D9C9886